MLVLGKDTRTVLVSLPLAYSVISTKFLLTHLVSTDLKQAAPKIRSCNRKRRVLAYSE